MIALVILGLGLLFIAAALPVGLEYTRQTVDMGTAEAVGQYALEQLELTLRTSRDLYHHGLAESLPAGPGIVRRLDNLHRPRNMVALAGANPTYPLRETYEPLIKVRPLAMGNVGMSAVSLPEDSPGPERGAELVDNAELAISVYLSSVWGLPSNDPTVLRREYEFPYDGSENWSDSLSLVNHPVLPGLARVYPPADAVTTFSAEDFFDNEDEYPRYQARSSTLEIDRLRRERQKVIERRVAWTAFYRRLSYRGERGPDNAWYTNDDVAANPLLYELIVIVTRRTSVNHRFPRQAFNTGGLQDFEQPQALNTAQPGDRVGADRLAPMPWLVTFDNSSEALPLLVAETDYHALHPDASNTNYEERVLLPDNFTDPPTLTFRCTREVGVLLPVGSVFIPAVNDQRYVPPPAGPPQQVGFVPSAPESLPIYEVVERPDDTSIVVKNNGYYPWLNPGGGSLDASHWPVWVIPPAFIEREPGSNGQPIYERTSPVLKVIRRVVTLREITS
jgi:hypothetical protein